MVKFRSKGGNITFTTYSFKKHIILCENNDKNVGFKQ